MIRYVDLLYLFRTYNNLEIEDLVQLLVVVDDVLKQARLSHYRDQIVRSVDVV
jgi:hypothetical protein